VKPPRRSPYEAQLKSFCDAIRAGRPAEITGLDGLKAQEVVQAAYLSMKAGGWIDLPLGPDAPFIVPSYA
jgi:predicted dehydrogenase